MPIQEMEYIEATLREPQAVSVTSSSAAAPTPLFLGYRDIPVFWIMVKVRSMGTATAIYLGGYSSQNITFDGVGQFQIIDVPKGYLYNAAQLFVYADDVVTPAVLEVTAMQPTTKAYAEQWG